jgi:hypothetical protein
MSFVKGICHVPTQIIPRFGRGVLLDWLRRVSGQTIRFAQLSDAHVYDSKNDDKDSQPENEQGFRWAIDEINRRNEVGPKFDFVVFTWDLNLETILKLIPSLNNLSEKHGKRYDELFADLERNFKPDKNLQFAQEIDDRLHEPVRQLSDFLNKSDVKIWIFLPGNNDLMDEMPVTIYCYHRLLRLLQQELGSRKTFLDFAPVNDTHASLVLGNCHFFGLDNSSFKNNNTTNYFDQVEGAQKRILSQLKDEVERSRPTASSANSDPKYYAYIFCHIPDVSDPYLDSLTHQELLKKLDSPGNRKSEGPYSRSAWTVTDETRGIWNKIIECESLKGVFAGHFHSHTRSQYQSLDWVKSPEYPSIRTNKLLICPPIAIKDQVKAPQKARGFRDVAVNNDTGAVTSGIVWLEESSQAHQGVPPARPDPLKVSPPAQAPR